MAIDRYPTLSTFTPPKSGSVDVKGQIWSANDSSGVQFSLNTPIETLPAWIPNTPIKMQIQLILNYKSIRETCKLVSDDALDFLIVLNSNGTREKRTYKFGLDLASNFLEKEFVLEIEGDFLAATLDIDFLLLVSPKAGVSRSYNSPSLKNTILWNTTLKLVLEESASLAEVRTDQLDGTFWRIHVNVPSDIQEWILMDFNRAVILEIDINSIDDRKVRLAAYAELLFLVVDHVVTTPGALQLLATSSKLGSFMSEIERKLLSITGLGLADADKIIELWPSHRYEYLSEMQSLVNSTLKQKIGIIGDSL